MSAWNPFDPTQSSMSVVPLPPGNPNGYPGGAPSVETAFSALDRILASRDEDTREDRDRKDTYARAWERYENTTPTPFPEGDMARVTLNWIRAIVDRSVSALTENPPTLEVVTDATNEPNEELQRTLDELLEDSRFDALFSELALMGTITGHEWVKVSVVPKQKEDGTVGPDISFAVQDSATVSVLVDPSDKRRVLRYRIEGFAWDPETGEMVRQRQLIDRYADRLWRVRTQIQVGDDRDAWRTLDDVPWPYAEPPLLGEQNLPMPLRYYGLPDVFERDAETGVSINRLAFVLQKGGFLATAPVPYVSGTATETEIGQLAVTGELAHFENPDTKAAYMQPGSMIKETLEWYRTLVKDFLTNNATPPSSIGVMEGESLGKLSGLALQILWSPLIHKTNLKRQRYGNLLRRLGLLLLELSGVQPGLADIVVKWPESIIPVDQQVQVQVLEGLVRLGLSQHTALQMYGHGIDPDVEAEKKADEQQAALDQQVQQMKALDQGNPARPPAAGKRPARPATKEE